MFKISEFKSKVTDILRPNRFKCVYSSGNNDDEIKDIFFWVQKVNIPKIDIVGPTIRYRGSEYILPGDSKKEYITVTLLNDSEWKYRKYFEDIIKKLKSFGDNRYGSNFFENTGGKLEITHYNSSEEEVVKLIFEDVVPLEISSISLDQTISSQIETFDVVFYYSDYRIEVKK